MTQKSRASELMESMGAAVTTFGSRAHTSLFEDANAVLREADDFASNTEMVEYIKRGLPKALAEQGNIYVAAHKSLGGGHGITVKFVSNDYRDNPRYNNIEHNAYYRLIFMLHQSPESPRPSDKLKFEVASGVSRANKEKGLKNPRLTPQKTFRDAADKLIAWFKKNEKTLLDWPRDWLTSEALAEAGGREVMGTAEVRRGDRLLMQVPVYKGDTDYELLARAREHAKFTDRETRDLLRGSVQIKRHALGERVSGARGLRIGGDAILPGMSVQDFAALVQANVGNGATARDAKRELRDMLKQIVTDAEYTIDQHWDEIADYYLTEGERVDERMVDAKKLDLEEFASGVANALKALDANRFNVKYDEKTGDGEALYKGLKARFHSSGENLYVYLPGLFFKDAPEAGARAIRDVLEVASDLGGAVRESAEVKPAAGGELSEARVGRFYPTAPELTRQAFFATMMEHVYNLNVAADEGEYGVDREAVANALAAADKALSDWIVTERKGMATKLDAKEQLKYDEALSGIEAELLGLRSARVGSWEDMRDIILKAVELYGF